VPQTAKAILVRYNLGMACSSASQHVAAIEQFKIAQRLMDEQNVRDGALHNSLGWAYLQAGDYRNAIQQFRIAREPALYAKLTELTKRQVDTNLALAEARLGTPSAARLGR
jgi:tetratricopeptide (TPR) repeat protein